MKVLAVMTGLFLGTAIGVQGQSRIVEDFLPACKTLDTLIYERTSVRGELGLKAVMKRGGSLDFYFDNSLSDLPWTYRDSKWFEKELKSLFPEKYRHYKVGRISSRGEKLQSLVTGLLDNSGTPVNETYRIRKRPGTGKTIVEKTGDMKWTEGLDGCHIALWQSHGLYYEQAHGRWEWQRPCLFQTVEDLFTQSYVLPFLVPMLENAGAYVMLPRERDMQKHEIIVDNDPDFTSDSTWDASAAPQFLRRHGHYSETGKWKDAGTGFADAREQYYGNDNPFRMGTARMAECVKEGSGKVSETVWTPDIPEKGEYAVYVSYKTFPNSTHSARYTVHHLGGATEFSVDQSMGGGTWIYLGTFWFAPGQSCHITLDNTSSDENPKRSVVTADAVKIGGGYGNIARSIEGDGFSVPEISGMPRFAEGARYWLQWAGADSTLFSQNEKESDYKDDFMCRGDWVAYMSGGSDVNPDEEGRNIPFDLAFALHSDAGTMQEDSIVGTLAIYTLKSEYKRKLPSGEDRKTSREFANLVQSQIVNDIRGTFEPEWNRRFIWDRSYRESRTPTCPSMLCELLSHQNFADMKYGHDPAFKFTVSRAIYKGMLKYLSNRYGCSYAVQPLPVNSFSVSFRDGKMLLKWKKTRDLSEPTADAEGFILQTRTDDGVFDSGTVITDLDISEDGTYSTEVSYEPGRLYSFRITAFNAGGKSFPSETLSAGTPAAPHDGRKEITDSCVLVVNNFDRVSSPAWFDTPEFAGFDNRIDSGVPYMRETSFTGTMYENRRGLEWVSNASPGFGASHSNYAGTIIAGNTFDYPAVHGRAILDAGYPFCSGSAAAFCADPELAGDVWCMDLICGKQVSVPGRAGEKARYETFPDKLQEALRNYTAGGGNVLVSGAYIATDIWDGIYPVEKDSTFRASSVKFAEDVLGYTYVTGFGSSTGEVLAVPCRKGLECPANGSRMAFNNSPGERLYSVEAPDGIVPSSEAGATFLRYADTRISAGVCSDFGTYRTVCIGFPVEILLDDSHIDMIIKSSIEYLKKTEGHGQEEDI